MMIAKKHSHHPKCLDFLFVLTGFPVGGYFYPNTSLSFENLFFFNVDDDEICQNSQQKKTLLNVDFECLNV